MGYKGEIPALHYGEEDAHLDVGSGVIYWIMVNPSSDEWDLVLRDGSDTSAPVKVQLTEYDESGRLFRFDPPLPYYTGLFVDLIEDIRNFTIAFDHLEK